MQLNREKIQRMFTGSQANGGGGGGGDTEGLASELWVEQNYLSKEFFLRLFNIHGEDENDDPVDVQPNDLETTITDIEAMFGFWTEQYLSALGLNSEQGGGGITLNAALASINNSPLGNPTGTNTVLMFNGTTWVYASMGSTDMNTVWTALADGTDTHQINVSHLTTALSGYATTSQLSDYATVTDLEQLASYFNTLSGYFTNGAANEAVKLETARTIWGQQFDGTANVSGDITQATCLEFSGIAGTATNGGFIDFHYAGGGADYTSRIIEDVSGVLKINNTIWAQLSGNVSIGTSTISQTYKLDVAGYTKTTRLYLADGVYLEYDSTNSGVHLVGAGFYSDSYVSALGVNSGGGGGGSDYIPLTGSSSITGTLAPSVATADLGSSTNKWRNIYGTSLSISNTLTTYALTVNSSATVVGSITATNGNLVASTGYVSSAGGYKVTGKDDTSVLLAGGGTKPLSEIGSAYTLPAATAAALGGLKVNQSYGQAATVQASGNTGTRNYGLQIDSNGMGFVYVPWENTDNDTKNTAGATNLTATKMYLVGATEQSTNPQTYSNSNCYIGSDNCLYSGGSKVLTEAVTGFLPTSGGTLTGDLTLYETGYNYTPAIVFQRGEIGGRAWDWRILNSSGHLYFQINKSSDGWENYAYINGDTNKIYANGFAKIGGTSSQFLKADGSVDSSVYLTNSDAYTTSTTRTANTVLAAPNGSNGSASFRKLVAADIPDLSGTYSTIDTKNTAGNYMTSSKIWLVGTLTSSTVQGSYDVSYTNVNCYISGSKLYSNNEAVLTSSTETKNTAGNFNVGASGGALNKIYIVGTASYSNAQDSYQVTSVNSYCYIGTDNCLYSNGSKVLTVAETGFLPLTGGSLNGNLIISGHYIKFYEDTSWTDAYRSIPFSTSDRHDCIAYVEGNLLYNPYSHRMKVGGLTLTDGHLYLDAQEPSASTLGKTQLIFSKSGTQHVVLSSNTGMLIINPSSSSSSGQSWIGVNGKTSYFSGDVGIGTTPSYKLHVAGTICAYSFKHYQGTSSQFLKGDGSLDSTSYLALVNGNAQIDKSLVLGCNASGSSSFSISTSNADHDIVIQANKLTLKGLGDTSGSGGTLLPNGAKFYSICIECNSDGTPNSGRSGEINRYGSQDLHLQYDDGTGSVTMCRQGFKFTNNGSTRSITINASLQLTCGSGTPYTDKNWVYNSDMRKKDVIRLIDMDAQRIADAPIFDFTWKSDDVKVLTLGSSAQYWQTVFPNAVRQTPDGYLGMDYCSIALASAVLTARKVVDHEKRIRLLEVENAALRNEINQLKKVA